MTPANDQESASSSPRDADKTGMELDGAVTVTPVISELRQMNDECLLASFESACRESGKGRPSSSLYFSVVNARCELLRRLAGSSRSRSDDDGAHTVTES